MFPNQKGGMILLKVINEKRRKRKGGRLK